MTSLKMDLVFFFQATIEATFFYIFFIIFLLIFKSSDIKNTLRCTKEKQVLRLGSDKSAATLH